MELVELTIKVKTEDTETLYCKTVERLGETLCNQFMEEIPDNFDLGNFSKLQILIPLELQAKKTLETSDFIQGTFTPKNGLAVQRFLKADEAKQKRLLLELLENALTESTLKRRAKKEILKICRKISED